MTPNPGSDPSAASRWEDYLQATVAVHIDGVWLDLTGPGADPQWPFEAEVFALTAWDPAGRTCDREQNDRNNEQLRMMLADSEAQVWDSAGYSSEGRSYPGGAAPDPQVFGTFLDEGFVVAGPSEDEVIELAARFGQEAIYRLDAEHLTVISTTSPERQGRRRGALRSAQH